MLKLVQDKYIYLVPGLIIHMTAKSYDDRPEGQGVQPPLPILPAHQAGVSETLW